MLMNNYLRSSPVINWQHPAVRRQARELTAGAADPVSIARCCFEWTRATIRHSADFQLDLITCTASEVLQAGTGFCYAKSHLLAALLRAHGLPTGLCYQRLSRDDAGLPYILHGLNAVYLPEIGWYRMDPRGNRPGINAQFTPPLEQLAFPRHTATEYLLPEIYPDPLPVVVQTLRRYSTYQDVLDHLPEI